MTLNFTKDHLMSFNLKLVKSFSIREKPKILNMLELLEEKGNQPMICKVIFNTYTMLFSWHYFNFSQQSRKHPCKKKINIFGGK